MTGWEITRLGDVLNFQRGFDITKANQRPGSIPVVSSGGIGSFHDTSAAKGPGVVIGRKGTLGKTYYLPDDYWPHDTTLWVQDFKNNFPRFVYYFMTQLDVSWLDTGSANPTLNRNHLHPLKVMWPPFAEQRAIAEVLGALDDKITANNQLITTSNNLALSLLHTYQASVPLSEIVAHKKGAIDISTLGASVVAHFSLPAFDAEKLPDLCTPKEIKSNKAYIQSPSVLISKLNPRFPRVWNLPELPEEPAVASTEFLVLEPKFTSTSVLWAILSQEQFKRSVETKVAGTSGSHQRVKPTDLLATKTIDPRDISSESKDLIEDLCQTSFHLQYENRHLETTRDVLLPHLMSGKIRVREAESIVESVL